MSMAKVRHVFAIWRQLLVQYSAISFTYRAQAAIWMIGGFIPLAMMLVWIELAADGPIAANGAAYDQSDFALYFMGMYFVRQATVMWCVILLDRGIRHGELAPLLLRPMPPTWAHMAEHLAEIVIRLPVITIVFVLGLWLTGVFGRLDLANLPVFLSATAAAWLIFFNIHYCTGLLAFWMEGALSLEPLIWYLCIILGGSVIPIDLFPSVIRRLVIWLPFASVLDFPVQVLLGKLTMSAILLGFARQLVWIALLTWLRQTMWRHGMKRFSAVGA